MDRLIALQSAEFTHPGRSAFVLAQLIIGLASLAAFVVWEWKYASEPMIPREMFAGLRIVGMAFGIAFVAGRSSSSMLIDYQTDGSGQAWTRTPS